MQITFLTQLDWLIRLILAGVCGYAIGYERNSRSKNAGTRTHLIVALSAALMIIVSKYGFMDIISTNGVNLDPSRIAAQIVSGIGFLGAGMIFVHNQSVNGLTTAAGIWATSGIGMAIGSGLYFIGIVATLLILLFQIILHQNYRWIKSATSDHLILQLEDFEGLQLLQQQLKEEDVKILSIKVEKKSNNSLKTELYLNLPKAFEIASLMSLLESNDKIKSIEY
ncbi:MgtC/SapB family protein [Lactococcus lactis]|uniref:MgtC/SapB family protein n=1 Tax=Lactococcus lactis TaxID=1358 RepID=UPI000C9EEB79|nr:MgtC/SapB family protein [Lactococcus lactis]AUS70000.1 methyltransferase [Lactococcus lactis subsp. lactis]MDG4958741.1 MgtC/SapB family protein [Lactococcus lactis]MDG4965420.1 MgtC/SapB family protein [Lactococcus lactis]MDG4985556.1 MgtC/SapB family protein [Lactococcus lactis]WKF72480.1 MgtC/SapB family protein [Lactococcus lactis]